MKFVGPVCKCISHLRKEVTFWFMLRFLWIIWPRNRIHMNSVSQILGSIGLRRKKSPYHSNPPKILFVEKNHNCVLSYISGPKIYSSASNDTKNVSIVHCGVSPYYSAQMNEIVCTNSKKVGHIFGARRVHSMLEIHASR